MEAEVETAGGVSFDKETTSKKIAVRTLARSRSYDTGTWDNEGKIICTDRDT